MAARTPEGKVKAEITRLLKQYKIWYYMPVAGGYTRGGIPDYDCVVNSFKFTIEAKTITGRVSELQKRCMQELRDNGVITLVVNEDNLHALTFFLHIAATVRSTYEYTNLKTSARNLGLLYEELWSRNKDYEIIANISP